MRNNELLKLFNPLDFSGKRDIGPITAPLTEDVLFEVRAQEPLYLKTGSWDKYENNQWMIENKSLMEGHYLEKNITRLMKLDAIVKFVERLEDVEGVDKSLDELTNIASNDSYSLVLNKEREAVIESNYPIESIFMTTDGVTKVGLIDGRSVYKNELGFVFRQKRKAL